jgi:hypothetical protein
MVAVTPPLTPRQDHGHNHAGRTTAAFDDKEITMSGVRTYFGLPVIDGMFVRHSDIGQLPFFTFWQESAKGSVMLGTPAGDDYHVYLHDWEHFSRLLITTGRRRNMPVQNEGC